MRAFCGGLSVRELRKQSQKKASTEGTREGTGRGFFILRLKFRRGFSRKRCGFCSAHWCGFRANVFGPFLLLPLQKIPGQIHATQNPKPAPILETSFPVISLGARLSLLLDASTSCPSTKTCKLTISVLGTSSAPQNLEISNFFFPSYIRSSPKQTQNALFLSFPKKRRMLAAKWSHSTLVYASLFSVAEGKEGWRDSPGHNAGRSKEPPSVLEKCLQSLERDQKQATTTDTMMLKTLEGPQSASENYGNRI